MLLVVNFFFFLVYYATYATESSSYTIVALLQIFQENCWQTGLHVQACIDWLRANKARHSKKSSFKGGGAKESQPGGLTWMFNELQLLLHHSPPPPISPLFPSKCNPLIVRPVPL